MTPESIKAFRAKHGLSQSALARLLPVGSRRVIQSWEAGIYRPPDYLCRALRDLERQLTA